MHNRLTLDMPTLFIDQYGRQIIASTCAELKGKAGYYGAVKKQYQDRKSGPPAWTGYVLGRRWFTAFKRVELPAD